ncbi:MAG: hypothetical protein IKJ01_00595, partial [Lachnospiraceae bacterium]|nr:hypothetical protein [Lachnospiraceae bacterium]
DIATFEQDSYNTHYYTLNMVHNAQSDFEFIFNRNGGSQTYDCSISYSDLSKAENGKYECWVLPDKWDDNDNDNTWKCTCIITTDAPSDWNLKSPIINGTTVTFNYRNPDVDTVYLAGSMTDWGNGKIKMSKDSNGVFSYTTTLAAGEYKYKFIVGNDWIADPLNSAVLDGDGNSSFTITEVSVEPDDSQEPEQPVVPEVISPVINGKEVTFNYYNENNASKVQVVGDFTDAKDWDIYEMSDEDGDNVFSYTMTLGGGKYPYKFITTINGEDKWITDPKNDKITSDNDKNSYFIISGLTKATLADTITKGSQTNLPSKSTYLNADGTETTKEVTWSIPTDASYANDVTITDADNTNVQTITVAKTYTGTTIDVIATNKEDITDTATVTINLKEPTYKYTVYAYSSRADRVDTEKADLWIWDKAAGGQGSVYGFSGTETLSDGKTWLKAEITLNYGTEVGFIYKEKTDGEWTWKTTDLIYKNTDFAENNTIYITDIDGAYNLYTKLEDVPKVESDYVVVEYTREDANYAGFNVYTWNTGYGELTYDFTEVNGKYIAKIPVLASDKDKTIGFIVRNGKDWDSCIKDGGDNFVTIPAGQDVVKVRFSNGKVKETLPYNTGSVIDRKNSKVSFYYRDDSLFANNNLSSLDGKVKVVVATVTELEDGTETKATNTYNLTYDEKADRYVYEVALTDNTDYYYYYVIDGTEVLDAYNAKKGTLEGKEYSLRRNRQYALTLNAGVKYESMTYDDNNVLTVSWTPKNAGDDLEGFNPIEVYADLSALGLGSKVAIDTELMEFTFGCLEGTEAGSKTITVTLVDDCDMTYTATTTVTVAERTKTENTDTKLGDFDWDEAVIYFAVTDRFFDGNTTNNDGVNKNGTLSYHGGDFAGLTEKINYLYDLGVNTIWLTPIVENSDTTYQDDNVGKIDSTGYHGYWTSDFTKLNPHLGTETEFKALIEAAHAKGMKVMVDVVLNHAGYGTEKTFNSIIAVKETTDMNGKPVTIYKDMLRDESNTVVGDMQLDGLSGLPDFVTEDPEVRAKIIEWQTTWMTEYAIDYYRVDTVKHVDNTTWSEFKNELTKINQDFKLIGEYYDAGYLNDYDQLDSGKMDSVLDFHFNDILTNLASENLSAIEDALLQRNGLLTNTATLGSFLSSHDENGFLYDLINKHGEDAEWAKNLMKVAATYQITAKGQPVIYYGEEIGLTGANNYPKQDNRYDFNWTEQATQASDTSSMYNHYKTMLNIRRDYSEVFAKGDRTVIVEPITYDADGKKTEQGYEVFARSYEGTTIYVGTNVWGDAKEVTFYVNAKEGSTYKDLYNDKT